MLLGKHLRMASTLCKHLSLTPVLTRQYTLSNVNTRLLVSGSQRSALCHKRTLAEQSKKQTDVSAGLRYQQLGHRGLIRFAGPDSTQFLQGLITNDMNCLQRELDCHKMALYAFLLNVKGRVVCDMFVYNISKAPDTHIYLLEVDTELVDEVHTTMKKYRLRKKVDIAVTDELKVVAVFPVEDGPFDAELTIGSTDGAPLVAVEKDPRLTAMGYRLVLPAFDDVTPHLPDVKEADTPTAYHVKRLRLGIGEGPTDHPPGKALPLECNAAYLHGVSFDKGCYIGQELTARTHHTGMIRKRIMPLLIDSQSSVDLQAEDVLVNSDGKECGIFRSAMGQNGLGLMRVDEAKGPLTVRRKGTEKSDVKMIDGVTVTAQQPFWWPSST
ncbi:putative transferase CAF17 homolog, mitochondrial [Lingula anatina]|uniref:Transferase CAF17 homolog, mitochondrial n=1 Tax=Lingula anatina TaxID=7574 RepID=A0A1S3IZ76_LINAN|nr:putative transferase CAF17 homolog, mitochondrial [Lingula anatina]XP_013403291.1 putative transferase CAF17 homolog, mitochondrial [Lingula anatina]XP_013403299.1 putative transferase CAF17 homolog, mitochondrial [Lingula anatina]|eukprot:XP_013403283.1 putative transferase CAF17 homolog, mitochondrial [Lingula anatina]